MGQFGPINHPQDCLQYPLIQDSERADWGLWLKAHGVMDDPRMVRGDRFDEEYLLVRAAEAGNGIALVEDIYAAQALASGALVVAVNKPWPSHFAYYAVTLESHHRPEIDSFIQWILKEIRLYSS